MATTSRCAKQLSALALAAALLAACGTPERRPGTEPPAPSATSAATTGVQPTQTGDPSSPASTANEPTPEAPSSRPNPLPTAEPEQLSIDGVVRVGESRAIAETILAHLKPARPDKHIVVGTYAAQDDYAAALALPFGERPQYIYLKRDADEAWQVLLATSMPSLELLKAQQIPAALADGGAPYAIVDALASQMQDPRGSGVEADLYIDGIEGDYALIALIPLTNEIEGGAIYLKHDGTSWARLTAGSHFDHATLRELGIPEELWAL